MDSIGYDWKPAEKRKPKAYEVVKFRSAENDDKEYFAVWTGDSYYIFDIYAVRWKPVVEFMSKKNGKEIEFRLTGYYYAYIPRDQTRYIPYWSIANSRRSDIFHDELGDKR